MGATKSELLLAETRSDICHAASDIVLSHSDILKECYSPDGE